jgi:hypothetical protein
MESLLEVVTFFIGVPMVVVEVSEHELVCGQVQTTFDPGHQRYQLTFLRNDYFLFAGRFGAVFSRIKEKCKLNKSK